MNQSKTRIALIALVLAFLLYTAFNESGLGFFNRSSASEAELNGLLNVEIDYFRVFGRTVEEIRNQIDRKGPVDRFGIKRDAYVKWYVFWNWDEDSRGIPDLSTTTSGYRITVSLPKWEPPPEAAEALKQEWGVYMARLASHERNHINHVLENYRKVEEHIRTAARENPSLTVDEANKIGEKVLESIRKLDVDYDKRTEHGLTEGIRFGPEEGSLNYKKAS